MLASPVCFFALYVLFALLGWISAEGQLEFDRDRFFSAPFWHSMFVLSTFFLAVVHLFWEWKARKIQGLIILGVVALELFWFILSFGSFWQLR